MILCSYCNKENADDFSYCRYCGNNLAGSQRSRSTSFWKKLPSWAWIPILGGGIIAMIAMIIFSFVAIATIEGVASLIILAISIVAFGIFPLRRPLVQGNFWRALTLLFLGLMGASVDQPGNIIYNKPVEWCFCEDGSKLHRGESVTNPLPGTTYITQDFTCYNAAGEPVNAINVFKVAGVRFVEYILLGYILIGLRNVLWRLRRNPPTNHVW